MGKRQAASRSTWTSSAAAAPGAPVFGNRAAACSNLCHSPAPARRAGTMVRRREVCRCAPCGGAGAARSQGRAGGAGRASRGMQSVLSSRLLPAAATVTCKVAARLSPGKCWSWAPLARPPACPAPGGHLLRASTGLQLAGVGVHLSRVLISRAVAGEKPHNRIKRHEELQSTNSLCASDSGLRAVYCAPPHPQLPRIGRPHAVICRNGIRPRLSAPPWAGWR